MEEKKSVFEELNKINCSDKVEKKNGLTYLSWSYAWGELLKRYPDATYKIYENEQGWNYFTDGKTAWVKTSVTVNDKENIEYLPIMDFKNKSMALDQITSVDVNKTIQRSVTKCIARFGLGLYIYAGEDLPEEETKETKDAPCTENQLAILNKLSDSQKDNIKNHFRVTELSDLTVKEASEVLKKLKQ